MMIINIARWLLAVVLALALLPIMFVFLVFGMLAGSILALLEEIGLDTDSVGETLGKMFDKVEELYKRIILKVAPQSAHL